MADEVTQTDAGDNIVPSGGFVPGFVPLSHTYERIIRKWHKEGIIKEEQLEEMVQARREHGDRAPKGI